MNTHLFFRLFVKGLARADHLLAAWPGISGTQGKVPEPEIGQEARAIRGFALMELVVVVGLVAILAALLVPALAKASGQDQAIQCLNNTHKLVTAWTMYADDNSDACVNNFGVNETIYSLGQGIYNTWCEDLMSWTADPQTTNTTLLLRGLLGRYMGTSAIAFKCPADNFLSTAQAKAGYQARVRSYSMNNFLGYFSQCANCVAGPPRSGQDVTYEGEDWSNPAWPQYVKVGGIPQPSQIFVFLDEHPDTINDGYFTVNQGTPAQPTPWGDCPASYHNGACSFCFSDGHSEIHKWLVHGTDVPVESNGGNWPGPSLGIPADYTDRNWICGHACMQ